MGNCSSPQTGKDPKSITVYYWGPHPGMNMYGRAIAIYLTLDQAGFEYDKQPPNEMPGGSPPNDICFAVPAVKIDGRFVSQTPAILAVLGELFGLGGKTPEEKGRVLHALEDMNDLFGEHGKFTDGNNERKRKWFTYLEKKLKGKQWWGGTSEPTVADFHGVFAFEWIVKKKIDFSAYPNTTKWWEDIQAVPVVAKMKESCVDGRTMVPP